MKENTGKTTFIKRHGWKNGQTYIDVIYTKDGQSNDIGRIYREDNKVTKKSTYLATDVLGNQIFKGHKELSELEQNFIKCGDTLAMAVPMMQIRARKKEELVFSRNNDLKNIRDKKTTKEKNKEVSKPKLGTKLNNDQKEKEQDAKNQIKYKNSEQAKEGVKDNVKMQEKEESNSENKNQEDIEDAKTSERQAELDELRDNDDDREQEQEQELELDM